ncbi:hypothetical protein SCHPADRAFT_287525 [Schizopora paradoxa]|uniref:MARVEL domain-containing protein n=1 Tax=Schizopora paradoxa TaxID=27342 RepID=A0A0H2RTS1_9AGAM|nr:hypothetical protein SCHPADRAFT_287525 [Schizopora paradoxa]
MSPPPPPPKDTSPRSKPAGGFVSHPRTRRATTSAAAAVASRVRRLSSSSSLVGKKGKGFSWFRFRRPSLFNCIRVAVFLGVILWTVVCLAIAVHFDGILVASDLTHFVPFAIFASVATLLIILVLLISSPFKQRNPVSTRIELGLLGLLGVLWLALSVFLATSESAEADVECFAADSVSTDPTESPTFSTATYHAQYRVLMAFSIFNAILVWGFLLFLLFLAFREHRKGHVEVWREPVPVYPWFGRGEKATKEGLPAPVTAMYRRKSSRRKDSTRRPTFNDEKDQGGAKKEKRKSAFWVWVEKPRGPPKARTKPKETSRNVTIPTTTAPRRVVRDTVINITRPTVPRASTMPNPARGTTGGASKQTPKVSPPRTTTRSQTQPQLSSTTLPRTQSAPRIQTLPRSQTVPKMSTVKIVTKR